MNRKHLAYLFLVPLLVACYAVWQHWRVSDILESVESSNSLIQTASDALKQDPKAIIEFTSDGKNYRVPATEVIESERSVQNEYAGQIMLARTQSGLASFAVGLALLCIVLNAGAIALCRRSVTIAKQSQDALVQAFDKCRKLLPWLMVSQIVCCGLALFAVVGYETLWFATHYKMNAGGIKVMLFALVILFGILWVLYKSLGSIRRCFALFQPEPNEVVGYNLTREQAPALWSMVEALSQKTGAMMPDNIVVGMLEGFYVTANSVQLEDGPLLTGQTLYFPLTWAALLDKDETCAVIGHELGHFAGQDTQYSLRFAPLYAGITNSINTMAQNQQSAPFIDHVVLYPSLYMGVYFIEQLHETVSHWSRIREHAADEMGARASSPQALASSLLRISAVSEPLNNTLEDFFNGKPGFEDLVAALVTRLREEGFGDIQAYLEHKAAHPTDSHPPSRARIEALGCAIDDTLIQHATRAVPQDPWENLRLWFAQPEALSGKMTGELAGKAAEHREEFRRELEEVVQQSGEAVTLYSGKKVFFVGGILAVVLFIATVAMLKIVDPFNIQGIADGKIVAIAIGTGLLGLLTCYVLWQQWQKREIPFLTMTPDSLHCRQFTAGIPLSAIEDFSVQTANDTTTVTLIYREGFEPPRAVGGRWKNYTRVKRGKRKLAFVFIGGLREGESRKAYSADMLVELLVRNLNAIHARDALSRFS
ncbi:M48 family metallopeptidase [Cronobacter malonaticus]